MIDRIAFWAIIGVIILLFVTAVMDCFGQGVESLVAQNRKASAELAKSLEDDIGVCANDCFSVLSTETDSRRVLTQATKLRSRISKYLGCQPDEKTFAIIHVDIIAEGESEACTLISKPENGHHRIWLTTKPEDVDGLLAQAVFRLVSRARGEIGADEYERLWRGFDDDASSNGE